MTRAEPPESLPSEASSARSSSEPSSATSANGGEGVATAPTNIRWSVFAVSLATSAILYLHRYSFSFVKPALAKEWNLSNLELAKFDSAFATSYSGFQLPLAVLADVAGVRLVLTALVVIWCAGLGMLAYSPSGGWVAWAQALVGLGQSAVYACLARISRVWYPPQYRTTWQGIVSVLAGRLGAIGASLVFSTLLLGACGLTWRMATGILSATAAVLAVAVVALLRDSPSRDARVNEAERRLIAGDSHPASSASLSTRRAREASEISPDSSRSPATASPGPMSSPDVSASSRLSLRGRLRAFPRPLIGTFGMLALQAILSTFADNVYSNWLPRFLSQVHQLDYQQMGVYTALPLLGGALAGFVAGTLNDWLIGRFGGRRWARAGVAIAGKGGAAVVLLVALTQYDRPYVFCGMLFVVKLLSDWSLVSALGVITDVGGRATASVFALMNTIAGIGQISAPLAFGYVADEYGWYWVFVSVAAAYVLCAGAWLGIDADAGGESKSLPSTSN